MNRMKRLSNVLPVLAVVLAVGLLPSASAVAQPLPSDVITVATASGAAGSVVDVPVFIRDTSATPLGIDQPAGSRIQSYSIRVTYSSPFIQSISFSRAGITAALTPAFESSPAVPGSSIALLDNFEETSNLIPFTSNAPLPGNQVAHLLVTLAPNAPAGTSIPLTLDPVLTQLTDEGGTPATIETVANSRLTLVSGAVNVTVPVPALSHWALALLAVALAVVALRMRLS
jgi:exosortase sorting signal-containing protein